MHPGPAVSSRPHWSSFAWPRTYRSGGFGAALVHLLGAAFALGGACGFGAVLRLEQPRAAQVAAFCVLSAASIALGVIMVLETLRARYTLSRDAIEVEGLFGRRSLRRDEIAGYLTWVSHGITTWRLLPAVAGRKRIDVSAFGVATDEAFLPWILSLPDLAAVARDAARAEALADPAVGADASTRSLRLDASVRTATALNAATTLVSLWTLIYPRPYLLATTLCALLPWLALALVGGSPRTYSLGAPDGVRGNLGLPLVIPGAVLALRVLQDRPLVEWTSALAPAAVALCLLMAAHHAATRAQKPPAGERLMIAFLGVMWAVGAVALANAAFGRGTPWAFHDVPVRGRHVSHGKATTWYLSVDPWGGRRERNDVMVPRSMYEATPDGATVCIGVQPGALGMPWYWVFGGRCPAPRASR